MVILGAGAAGLIAASEFADKCRITIIDSLGRPGGRIHSLLLPHGEGVVESGAEFIHGNLPLTNKLIRKAGLTKVKVEGKMFRVDSSGWHEQQEMIEGWDLLLKKLKEAQYEQSMRGFLDEHFPVDQYYSLREYVAAFVGGYDLADVRDVSAKSLFEEWSAEEEQYRLKEGYSAIVNYLVTDLNKKGCTIKLGDAAVSVSWSPGAVSVLTTAGVIIKADMLLVTLPVSVMRMPGILTFIPLIEQYTRRYEEIGFGSVVKLVFDFHEKFWRNDLGFIFSKEQIPTWWSQYPIANNLLTGWAGGPAAELISRRSEKEIQEAGEASLCRIFNLSPDDLRTKLRASYVFNWKQTGNFGGAYSFATPQSRKAREILAGDVSKTIFFAGEGLVGGAFPGTVEAALLSGVSAAKNIKSQL